MKLVTDAIEYKHMKIVVTREAVQNCCEVYQELTDKKGAWQENIYDIDEIGYILSIFNWILGNGIGTRETSHVVIDAVVWIKYHNGA